MKYLIISTLSFIISTLARRTVSYADVIHGAAGGILFASWLIHFLHWKEKCLAKHAHTPAAEGEEKQS